ncbi:MAG: 30S ribosomal protein S4 [Candidatus Pacebacteria bacterium]|nr:30S ribosomal protein S4 [Candidatus Paceibacterota bacterium]
MIIEKKCKKCRRAGEKLFLKGEKCFTPKCVFEKKPFPPGLPLSARKHRSMMTEYGIQLKEKQKVRNVYRLSEKQFSAYVKNAASVKDIAPTEQLFRNLETRLDNVAFRLGFANSRPLARQIVSHGHLTVNGRRVDIPSYKLRKDDVVELREQSKAKPLFADLVEKLQKHTAPSWLKLDAKKMQGVIQGDPSLEHSDMTFNLTSVMEYYSR